MELKKQNQRAKERGGKPRNRLFTTENMLLATGGEVRGVGGVGGTQVLGMKGGTCETHQGMNGSVESL